MEKGKSIVHTASLTTHATIICGPSEKRLALLFSPPIPGTAFYTISTDPAVTLGGGINLSSATSPVAITAQAHGDAPVRSWYGVASAAMTIGFLETVDT